MTIFTRKATKIEFLILNGDSLPMYNLVTTQDIDSKMLEIQIDIFATISAVTVSRHIHYKNILTKQPKKV